MGVITDVALPTRSKLGAPIFMAKEEIYYEKCSSQEMGPRNRPHEFCSFAVADMRNRDRLAWFGGSCSYIISFRLDAALRRSKTICLGLGETASINSKLCIIKR